LKSLLLDGHTILWTLYEPEQLPTVAADAIADSRNSLFVSEATLWELVNKPHRIPFANSSVEEMVERIEQLGASFVPITRSDIIASALLPRHHLDPFDRIIVAQARAKSLTIVTIDNKIPLYEVDTLWR
jgi:PIN domain nuclease of toxin-antitoxin system